MMTLPQIVHRPRPRRKVLPVRAEMNWRAEVRTRGGVLVQCMEGQNLLLDEGLNWWLYNMFNDISGSTDRGTLADVLLGDGSTAATRSDTALANLVETFTGGLEIEQTGATLQARFFLAFHQYNGNTLREYLIRTGATTGSQPTAKAFTRVVFPQNITKTADVTVTLFHRFHIRTDDTAFDTVITRLGRAWMMRRLHDPDSEHCTRVVAGSAPLTATNPETDTWLAGASTATDTLDAATITGQVVTPNGQFASGAAAFTISEMALAKVTSNHILFLTRNLSLNGSANAVDYDYQITLSNPVPYVAGSATVRNAAPNGDSVEVTLPTNTDGTAVVRDGDGVLLIVVQGGTSTSTFTAPAGFSSVIDKTVLNTLHAQVFAKIASSEGTTYTVTSDATNVCRVAVLIVRRGHASTVVDVSASNSANSNTPTAATVTPNDPARVLIVALPRAAVTFSAAPDRYDALLEATGGVDVPISVRQQVRDNVATGTPSWTISSGNNWITFTLALKPKT